MTRRGLAALLLGWRSPARAQPQDLGPPLAVVTLRIGPADDAGFLHDLADYTNRYGFDVTGRPGGPVLDGRAVFLAWFRRQDGVTMLVTDLSAPEKMQAFFYGRPDGTAGAVAADLCQAYVAKMASYKAFGGGPCPVFSFRRRRERAGVRVRKLTQAPKIRARLALTPTLSR